jgi:hypothetical protein
VSDGIGGGSEGSVFGAELVEFSAEGGDFNIAIVVLTLEGGELLVCHIGLLQRGSEFVAPSGFEVSLADTVLLGFAALVLSSGALVGNAF